MALLPRSLSPLVTAALFTMTLTMPAVAGNAPNQEGDRVVASKKRVTKLRTQIQRALVPGQPVRFPRELLPELIREREFDIEEPSTDAADEPGAELDRHPRGLPVIGPNRIINNRVGDPAGATQSENAFAARGRFMVAGWNESFDPGVPRSFSGYAYSSDGGETWTDGGTLPRAGATDFHFGDPVLAVDDDGNFYYASLYTPDGVGLGVSVNRGRFKGKSLRFDPPVMVAGPGPDDDGLDKEWIAVDPERGTVYVTYTRFFLDGSTQIELVQSRDRGRTWSEPEVISDRASEAAQGSRPAVGPRHEVHVVYTAVDLGTFTSHMRIRTSKKGGTGFGPTVNVGEGPTDVGIYPNVVAGPPGFNRSTGVELPSIAVAQKGRDRGTVYVTWPEAINFYDDPLGYAGVQSEAEGNDTPATAMPITLGVLAMGSFVSTGDADWYAFTGTAGETVEFYLVPAPGSTADGFLRLFAPGGATADRLAFSYFGAGIAFIVFTLPADGTYLVRALPTNPSADIGNYYLFTGLHQPSPLDVARDSRDVMLSRSRDGRNWTRREVVNHDAPRFDNAFPEVAVDDLGDVSAVWYDHRNDPARGILTDVYYSRSLDRGEDFGPDQRVTDASTNWNLVVSRLQPNMGDYIALVADGDRVHANWADGRQGDPDSWMATIRDARRDRDRELIASSQSAEVELAGAAPAAAQLRVGNPVRAGAPIAMSFDLPRGGQAQLNVYSVAGQRVRGLVSGSFGSGTHHVTWDARGRDGSRVAPGVYFAVLRTLDGELTKRMVLIP